MQLNRSIAFTSSWLYTLYTGLLVGLVLSAILVFLQPFDTYQLDLEHKNLKLWGYGLCILVPVLIIHIPERSWYKKQQHKWFLGNEIVSLTVGFIGIMICCYCYNTIVVNNLPLRWGGFINWCLSFGIPFIPFLIPVWLFLRHRFSSIEIQTTVPETTPIAIMGQNQNEQVTFTPQNFIMAQVQSNYVELYYHTPQGVEKQMIRATLSSLVDQIPSAIQVHRSYLINLSYVEKLQGNTRKGNVRLAHITQEVPVSPKHFTALKKELQFRPNTSK